MQVVSALSSCRPIVTPSWLEAASQCFSEGKALPHPTDYQPDVVDTNLDEGEVCFRPDFRRRTLFQDRTIYFLCNKQVSSIEDIVMNVYVHMVVFRLMYIFVHDISRYIPVFQWYTLKMDRGAWGEATCT